MTIAAMRERCARIVESQCGTGPEIDAILTNIAAAIREGVEED
jgi:hypothetical protein